MSDPTESALSVDESNKIRASLGLPLLEVAVKDAAEDNFTKHLESLRKQQERKDLKDKIQSERNKKSKEKMQGATLGDDKELDSLAWINSTRVNPIMQHQDSIDKQLQYTSADLTGLKVSHNLDDVTDYGETILVLKDSTIAELEQDGDQLENINIAELDRARRNQELSKGKKYNVYDDDEFQAPGHKKNILSHYDEMDEEIGFQIEKAGKINVKDAAKKKLHVHDSLKKATVSLDYTKNREISDYYTNEEIVAFRKPKKKSKRKIRKNGTSEPQNEAYNESLNQKNNDEDVIMTIPAFSNSNMNSNIESTNFVDDDDLQLALTRARKINRSKPSAINLDVSSSSSEDDTGRLVLSSTTEFVQNLDSTPQYIQHLDRVVEKEDSDEEMEEDAPAVEEPELNNSDHDEQMGIEERQLNEEVNMAVEPEPLVSSGLAATLALLKRQGVIASSTTTPQTEQGR